MPLSLREANVFVEQHHRHHKASRGHKFSIGAEVDGVLSGVVIVGRPVARGVDFRTTCEVTRLCTLGVPDLCSFLYGAAARAAKAMGYQKIQTYILREEPGTSLRASGFMKDGDTKGGDWNNGPYTGRRVDQPQGPKQRWVRRLL